MKNKLHTKVIFGLLTVFTLSRCNIDQIETEGIQIPNYQGEVGLIIGNAAYTMSDLIDDLEDSSLVIEEDNSMLLKVIYRDTTIFDDMSELVVIDDVTNPGSIQPGINIPTSTIEQQVEHVENLQFNYPIANDEELDSLVYNAGIITLDIQSNFTVRMDYEFVIDDIINRDTGQPLVFSGSIDGTGSDAQTLNLANHVTQAERIGSANVFTGTFTGTLTIENGDSVLPTETLDYSITIANVGFETIYGFFGVKNFDVQDETVDIKFFEDIDVDELVFNSPKITMTIENFVGVPMAIDLQNISSTNQDGQTVSLSGAVTANPQSIRAPTIANVGTSQTSAITINTSNSNIRDLLGIAPNQISLNVDAFSNYNIDPTARRNFVTDDGKANIYMELEMPLDVRLAGFTRGFDFSVDSLDLSDADTVHLLVRSQNYLPFTGVVDLQLVNPSIEDSILYVFDDILLIESPEIPLSGRADEPKETLADVALYGESLEAFLITTKLNLIMTVDSYNADQEAFVKIFSDHRLDLTVSLKANLNKEL